MNASCDADIVHGICFFLTPSVSAMGNTPDILYSFSFFLCSSKERTKESLSDWRSQAGAPETISSAFLGARYTSRKGATKNAELRAVSG